MIHLAQWIINMNWNTTNQNTSNSPIFNDRFTNHITFPTNNISTAFIDHIPKTEQPHNDHIPTIYQLHTDQINLFIIQSM